jgi:maltooligosyltrehalose trehalohydrolase
VTRPRVWAPCARGVEFVLADGRVPMDAEADGWWTPPIELPPGTDYRFALDGGAALPDPRSPSQPNGVHGPSRTVDHDAFAWADDGFAQRPLADAVVYELHVGTFSPAGTFDAAIERLETLVELGITHVQLMPVAEFSGDRGWGYDGVDLFAPHHAYGGPHGLKRFVDAAHAQGLGVLLDVVYNHLGPDGNYLDHFGPYFTDRYATPWGRAVNFDDGDSAGVRRFVVDNALMWMRDYHVDGLRLDAVHAIFDASPRHILEEIADATRDLEARVGRPLVVTAESALNDARLVRSGGRGYGLDAIWADDVHHAVHVALTGERSGYYGPFTDPTLLGRAMREPFVHADPASPKHPQGLSGDRFVAFVQNHDQVGNRARGDRLGHLVSPGRVRIAAALLLTSPYVPLIFAGEEWAASSPFQYFTGHESPDLADAVRDGRRSEFAAFGWDPEAIPDPQDLATFERSRLKWDERETEPHRQVLAWYRDLIALRHATPSLRDGDRSAVDADAAGGTIVVRRGPVSVAANLGPSDARLPIAGDVRMCWPTDVAIDGGCVALPPDGVVVAFAGR